MSLVIWIIVQGRARVGWAIRPNIQHVSVDSHVLEQSWNPSGEETDSKSVGAKWVSSGCKREAVVDEYLQERPVNEDVNHYGLCLVERTGYAVRLEMAVFCDAGEVWVEGRVEA
jgi:hypothetical protein